MMSSSPTRRSRPAPSRINMTTGTQTDAITARARLTAGASSHSRMLPHHDLSPMWLSAPTLCGRRRAGIVLKSDTQGFELEVLRGARRLMAQRAIALLFVEVSSSLLRNQGTSALRLMHWIRMRGYDCAHLRLAARVTPKGRSPVRFSVIDLPAPLLGRATIGFDELARVLQHAPPANMSGWTDLVCWPARIL